MFINVTTLPLVKIIFLFIPLVRPYHDLYLYIAIALTASDNLSCWKFLTPSFSVLFWNSPNTDIQPNGGAKSHVCV